MFPELSNTWSRYLYSRDMRLSTCTLSSTLLVFAFTLNLIIQDAMIGEWELDTKYYHIAIVNLSRRVWRLDETYACFTSTHLFIFPKCPPNIFRFSSSLYGPHVCKSKNVHITCYYVTLCELSLNILALNTWYHFINYFAYCYSFEEWIIWLYVAVAIIFDIHC